jgi:hypothetical protein
MSSEFLAVSTFVVVDSQGVRIWTGFNWLRIIYNGRLL